MKPWIKILAVIVAAVVAYKLLPALLVLIGIPVALFASLAIGRKQVARERHELNRIGHLDHDR